MRVRLLCGAHVVWDCLFNTGYPGFGVPVPLFIGYLISNLILLKTNTVRKSSLYNKIPSVPDAAHSLPWQHWTFHVTLFTTYMIFHQSNNVCHYNCSFSFTYLHVWCSQGMTLCRHFPIFMVGLFPTTPHSVHILIHKYQTANTYHVIFISSVI